MSTRERTDGTSGWHAGPALLAAYAQGRAAEVDAWSIEAHLTSCPVCRSELGVALRRDPTAQSLVDAGRSRLMADLPAHGRTSRRSAPHPLRPRLTWLVPPGALVAVLVAATVATALAAVVGRDAAASPSGPGVLLWLLSPFLPLAGVALCWVRDGDPWQEAVLATPSTGLRLVLWRTALVLAVALPASVLAGLVAFALAPGSAGAGLSWPVQWLLPCLALTAVTLAAGTVVPLERAALGVAVLWSAVVGAPSLLGGAHVQELSARLASLAPSAGEVPLVAGAAAQLAWAALAVVAAAVVVVRGSAYERLPRAGRSTA